MKEHRAKDRSPFSSQKREHKRGEKRRQTRGIPLAGEVPDREERTGEKNRSGQRESQRKTLWPKPVEPRFEEPAIKQLFAHRHEEKIGQHEANDVIGNLKDVARFAAGKEREPNVVADGKRRKRDRHQSEGPGEVFPKALGVEFGVTPVKAQIVVERRSLWPFFWRKTSPRNNASTSPRGQGSQENPMGVNAVRFWIFPTTLNEPQRDIKLKAHRNRKDEIGAVRNRRAQGFEHREQPKKTHRGEQRFFGSR